MITPAKRFQGWIETLSEAWKDKLAGWLASIIIKGSIKLMDALEDEALPSARDFLDRFPIPPEVKAELEGFTARKKAIHLPAFALMAIGIVVGTLLGSFLGWARPIANWTGYVGDRLLRTARLAPDLAIRAYWRGFIAENKLTDTLKDQGWSDEDIKAIRDTALYVPTAPEQVLWLAREVYEPGMIEKYGLDSELPVYEETDFAKIGVSPEQMTNYWRAHWEHASFMQMTEMLHRGLITEDDFWEWFRLVEIVPYWRDKLIQIVYTWPTRVDVRRWWDMRTIDEARLRELYEGMGYRGKNLEDYILWTKVYVAFPDLMARFKNGWLAEDDVRGQLITLGMPPERVEEMIQTKIKPDKPERVTKERDLTKTDIYKGVKKGVISPAQGIELLMDLGYDESEAAYIIEINIGALEGSPETYPEFKLWTQAYRKAVGLGAIEVPEGIIEASKEVAEAREALRQVETKERTDITEAQAQTALTNAEYRYRQLLIKWEAEKQSKT